MDDYFRSISQEYDVNGSLRGSLQEIKECAKRVFEYLAEHTASTDFETSAPKLVLSFNGAEDQPVTGTYSAIMHLMDCASMNLPRMIRLSGKISFVYRGLRGTPRERQTFRLILRLWPNAKQKRKVTITVEGREYTGAPRALLYWLVLMY